MEQEFNDAGFALAIFIYGGFCVFALAIQAFVCWLVAGFYRAIPEERRQMPPSQVWLNMIPLFNLVFNFLVYPKLSDSFRLHFDSLGRSGDDSYGDCGRSIAMAYCVCAALSIIPCVNYVAAPAALVLLIIYLVKANELKNRVICESAEQNDPGWS